MSIPAIIYLIILGVGLLTAAHQHGKPSSDNNFWATLIAAVITLSLLIWGGFFK